MSGNRKRRLQARLRREAAWKALWEAWHNPPCPEVEETRIEAVTRCLTL